MQVHGTKRWVILVLVSILGGLMVYLPFLKYSYYDQMVLIFTQYKSSVPSERVNEFMGNCVSYHSIVAMFGYLITGFLADKFSERNLLTLGGLILAGTSFGLGAVPSETTTILLYLIMAVGVCLVFTSYILVLRKLGTAQEQGRMYSVSEFTRAGIQIIMGFLVVAVLNKAVLPSGETDVMILGQQWKKALTMNGILLCAVSVAVFLLMPKDLKGNEENSEEGESQSITLRSAVAVLKLPGTWMVSLMIFLAYSFVTCASGYLAPFTVNVLGITQTQASSYAIVRNYFFAAVSTLTIGIVADKVGGRSKTLGIYLFFATVLTAVLLATQSHSGLCIAVTFVFAFVYLGMKGIYFAPMEELGIPLNLSGAAIGVISFFGYMADTFFPKLAGRWLDRYGNVGYNYIWYWAIGCGILGMGVTVIASRYAKKRNTQK